MSTLQTKKETLEYPPDSVEEGPLEYEIYTAELIKGSYILKPNNSPGYDTISNEMIKSLVETNSGVLVKQFYN